MERLTFSKKSTPCPVCSGTNGGCKSRENFVLCMTESTSKKFEVVNGWKNIGTSGDWAQFVPSDQQGRDSVAAAASSRAKADRAALLAAGLTIEQRHDAHIDLLAQLTLHDEDRADLQRRGLSEFSIESFCSVEADQTLDTAINPKTPGVGFGGKKLLTRTAGYLVPARDLQGRIAGFQIRNRTGDDPRYPWLSSADVSPVNLPNGEIPLTYAPAIDGGNSVYFAEGLLKPLIASELLDINLIGASGGHFASSPLQLTEWIAQLKPSGLILCPDSGAISNPHTMRQYSALNDLLASLGHELKVLWYGQGTKGDCDIDEISRGTFEQAAVISWTEFSAKDKSQRISALLPKTETAKPATKKPQTRKEWLEAEKKARHQQAYKQIGVLVGIDGAIDTEQENYKEVARSRFYKPLKKILKYETNGEIISGFAEELKPSEGRSLIAYDCSQGTGKSNGALIPAALKIAKNGGRVLALVPTRGLAREFANRINERAGEKLAATHLQSDYHSAQIVVSCPESAYKFKAQNFELLEVDEANEVFYRCESGELGNAPKQSLSEFRKLLARTPKVIIATAAMSGRTLAAAQTIGGFSSDEVQLQRRSRPDTEMSILEYSNIYQWLQKIIDAIASGQKVAIPTGAQGRGRWIDRVLRAKFPDKQGLVIDGKDSLKTVREKFLSNPDSFLQAMRPDWFIYSPVINSGVSIEGQYFNAQFEYACPSEGAQSISQRGERVRSAIGRDGAINQRHIYYSTQGAATLEAYPDALDWQYWASELENEANAPMGAAAALAKTLGADKALDPLKQDAEDFAGMRPNLPYYMALKAFEIIYRKELLHEDWVRFGWAISEVERPDKAEQKQLDSLKQLCDRIQQGLVEQQGRILKLAKTRESEGELDEIDNPFQAARAAKSNLEKLLGKDYLAAQDSKFFTAWFADKSANNPGVRSVVRSQLLQLAINEPELWAQIEYVKTLKFLAGKPAPDSDVLWHLPELPASARDIELVGIISRCPGIGDVVNGVAQQWTNQGQQVTAAGMYLTAHSKQIAANTKHSGLIRGAKFSDQLTPAALFNKALGLMGYKVADPKRQSTGKRLNVYRLAIAADATAKLNALLEDGGSSLQVFRAELNVIRSDTRQSINEAAQSRIRARMLAWGTEGMRGQIDAAIDSIRSRHADLSSHGLTELPDGLEKPAIEQRELTLAAVRVVPPLPEKSLFQTQNHDPLADDYYDSSAWGW